MSERNKDQAYSDDQVAARLARELPRWALEAGHLKRRYGTAGWKATLMVVNAIGHLAEAAWHHPEISASYSWVEVRLRTHDADAITDKDFALAARIEEVILWQPGKDGGALEGTPADKRFAYVRYD